MSPCESLLPPNRTQLEKALEAVICQRTGVLDPDLIRKLWNPWECPIELLPWLAWALSVDVWDDNWAEATKRKLVANSVQLHRKKGTLWAINQALQNLSVNADMTEWWQTEPEGPNGTATLDAQVSELMAQNVSVDQLIQSVERAKRYSIWIEYRLRDLALFHEPRLVTGLASIIDRAIRDSLTMAMRPVCAGLVTMIHRVESVA